MVVREAGRQRLGDHEPTRSEAGVDRRRIIEQWTRVEDVEHLRMRVPKDVAVGVGHPRQDRRQLATGRSVKALQEPVVAVRGERHIIVRELVGPVAHEHIDREILVDHDHADSGSVSVVVAGFARQGPVGRRDVVEGCLELVGEVAPGHPAEDLAACLAEARVAGPPATTALLDDLVPDAHGLQYARIS
jgi:hypothetical protein